MKLQAKQSVFMSRGRKLKRRGKVAAPQPLPATAIVYSRRAARRVKRYRRDEKAFNKLATQGARHVEAT